MGHTKVRCKEPLKVDENNVGEFGGGDAGRASDVIGNDFGASGGFGYTAVAAGGAEDWDNGGGGASW